MDDIKLTAALCGDRSCYEKLKGIGLDSTDFSEAGRSVVESAGVQYQRDASCKRIDLDVLRSQITRRFGAGSMSDSVMEYVAGFPKDLSKINVIEEYRLLRLGRVSTELATLLATGQHGNDTAESLAKYQRLAAGEEAEAFKPRLTIEDYEDDDAVRIPVYPSALNEFIGGGVKRGHNIVVYARPEVGKSQFALNAAAGWCRDGYKVLYVANEEPEQDITDRLLSRLAGCDIECLRNMGMRRRAFIRSAKAYKNWTLLHRAGVTARDIARQAARLRPDIIIIDQLKNLQCADENRALQLDRVAQEVRNLAIEFDCVTVSITQAGDSAEGRLKLSMNDIEWSNTGIPGAADLMIGIGVNEEWYGLNKRMLTVCKNKANGAHGSLPVWVNTKRTAMVSKVIV
jgi:KaiC/GvpD/RAD55 family RecA-like ATPase